MGTCCVSSRPEDDLRGGSSSSTNGNSGYSKKNPNPNPFKQPSQPDYVIDNKVSFTQAAKENTIKYIESQN